MSHADRYLALCSLKGTVGVKSEYSAAFYLLSYDSEVFKCTYKFVSPQGIEFDSIKPLVRNLGEKMTFLADIANNLYSYNSKCDATPFEISRLGYPLVGLVCDALYIADGKKVVEISQNSEGEKHITLNSDALEQAKRYHNLLQKLTSQPEQDEELEM